MLRVRPTRYTSALPQLRGLFESLGLVATEEGDGWAVLDSAGGRIRLQSVPAGAAEDGATLFGVEIREPREFARRTLEDGGDAVLEDSHGGPRVRVTGPDGLTFLAEPTAHAAQCADADPAVAVRLEWLTPDVPGALATLASIGARPRATHASEPAPAAPAVQPRAEPLGTEFTAKNGGVLAALPAPVPAVGGIVLEYDGDLAALGARLAAAGWSPGKGEAPGRPGAVVRLTIPVADGSPVVILPAPAPHAVEQ
ncbi:VOC family protein [Sinomonas mesophila]|uniref:VOC family protein n=1 Tax=Sinomonas mesophila TaxID=1531955 RepID=UPI0011155BD6|nr:VOC family protein [Sinomonas mesophila]